MTIKLSLDKLTRERGSYTYRYKKDESITKSIAAEDAKNIVEDFFGICKDMKGKVIKVTTLE